MPIDTEIAVTDTRRRTKMNQLRFFVNQKLDVIDKPKQCTAKFKVKVVVGFHDDSGARETENNSLEP